MPKLVLDRAQISKIAQGVPQTISALEKIFGDVASFPSTIEEANTLAGQALAVAHGALSALAALAEALAQLEAVPAAPPQVDPDDHTPRAHLGTISSQDADLVEITGGQMDNVPIGLAAPSKAKFTTLEASGAITSTVETGAPPLVVSSTTRVVNLNAEYAGTADSLSSPTTYPANANDLPSAIALVNALRAAAISKGL